MINCQEATRLISESRDRELTFGERVSLRFHVLMCHLCNRFRKTVDFLGLQASHYAEADDNLDDSVCLTDSAKERIRQALADDSQGER